MSEQQPEGRAKNVGMFLRIMDDQPLSLALVVMNFVLLGFLFYSGTSQLSQRQETSSMIVKWQQDTDKLMASCVSAEIMKLVLEAVQPIPRQAPPAEPK